MKISQKVIRLRPVIVTAILLIIAHGQLNQRIQFALRLIVDIFLKLSPFFVIFDRMNQMGNLFNFLGLQHIPNIISQLAAKINIIALTVIVKQSFHVIFTAEVNQLQLCKQLLKF